MYMIRWSHSSLELSLSSFAAVPISTGALVSTFFCLVVGTVDAMSMMMFSNALRKLFALQCHSAESEVERTLNHQLPDCVHLFLEPVLKLVCLVDERRQDVVKKLLHDCGFMSFTHVADQCCVC